MLHWTYNNHLTCGYHQNSQGQANKNIYFSQVNSLSRKTNSAFKEAQIVAKLIHQQAQQLNQELFLCLSAGVDSEAMLKAFMFAEVPFHVRIIRFNNNFNDYDIKEIIQYCEGQALSYEIFDLNIFDFFESGRYLEYGEKYQCQSPQLATHLYLCDHIKGCPVLSWQAPEVFYHIDKEGKFFPSKGLPDCLQSVYLRYFVNNKRLGVPFFFLYSPELLHAFYKLPFMQRLIWFGRMGAHACGSYMLKCMKYIYSGFPVTPKKQAYTGFEKIRDFYDGQDNKSYGRGFDDRYRVPLKNLNPLPKVFYQMVPENVFLYSEEIKIVETKYKKIRRQGHFDPDHFFREEMKMFAQRFAQLLQDSALDLVKSAVPCKQKELHLIY